MIRLDGHRQQPASKSDLVDRLIRDRLKELGIGRHELVRRMHYSNIAKGLRRLGQIRSGDMKTARLLRQRLADALELDASRIDEVIADTELAMEAQREAEHRACFKPHAIILASNPIPNPIFAVHLLRLDRLRRIEFEVGSSPVSYARQARRKLPEGIPCFGRVTGFEVHYSPDHAVSFDREGNPVGIAGSGRKAAPASRAARLYQPARTASRPEVSGSSLDEEGAT